MLGTLAAGRAVQGAREAVGARRARSPEPTLAGDGRGELGTAVRGASTAPHLTPPPRLREPSGAETGRKGAGGCAEALTLPAPSSRPHPSSFSFPFPRPRAHSPPSFDPGVPRRRRDRETPLQPGRPRDAAGPELLTWGRGTRGVSGAASSPPRPPSPLLPRTLSWAPSSETGLRSRFPRRRLGCRCRRQRTPSGGWKLGVSSGAGDSAAHARLRTRAGECECVCECARAPTGRGEEAERCS